MSFIRKNSVFILLALFFVATTQEGGSILNPKNNY